MDRATLRAKVLEAVEETTGRKVSLSDESQDLRTGLGLDSVDLVGVVLEVQDRLQIQLSVTDLEQVQTVGQLLDLLQQGGAGAKRAAA